MGVGGSPRELAKAIADGFFQLNITNLKKYGTSDQLRNMLNNLMNLEREIRNEVISEDDFEGTRKKHFRLGNIKKARLVIQGFAKSHRIGL